MAGAEEPQDMHSSAADPLEATGLSAIPGPDSERLARVAQQKNLLGQRKDGVRPANITVGHGPMNHTSAPTSLNPASSPRHVGSSPVGQASPRRNSSPFSGSQSPSRGILSGSPRRISPATSQIFERDVQESTSLAPELSPAIPSHIQTEDHIPPVLEASSLAISENLDPDEVEIVTHSAHLPAGSSVTQSSLGESLSNAHNSHSDLTASQETEESGSAYGAGDPTDPRRLSFISFADVVNSEHMEMGKDANLPTSFSSASPSVAGNRSPSPIRSQASPDRLAGSPPTSGSMSFQRIETSPVRGGAPSVASGSLPIHGEVTVETMRRTLQKTGSNEPGTGTASQPMSAVSADDGKEHLFK